MTNDSPPEELGRVDYTNPLVGLEHIDVIPRDVTILSTPPSAIDADDDFTWTDLRQIIDENNLSALKRRPHDLRNYLRWKHYIEETRPGGVLEFMLTERLHWLDSSFQGNPKVKVLPPVDPRFMGCVDHDLKILSNDFPYAMQHGIVHVVVWTRTRIPLLDTGDITPKSKVLINTYVTETFVKNKSLCIDDYSVVWFKNWSALQSIPALEHFHVLLYNPNMKELEKLYGSGGVQIDLQD